MKKFLIMLTIAILIIPIPWSIQAEIEENKTIFVDDDNIFGPWTGTQEYPYQFIQDAINVSSTGDIIFIFNGMYREKLVINKSINLIGEQKETTIIDGIGNPVIIRILADYVGIQKFSIINSSGNFLNNAAIIVEADYFKISENFVSDHPFNAIKLETKNSKISNNIFSFCDNVVYNHGCIYIGESENIELSYNEISYNVLGLQIVNSYNISIVKNNFFRNNQHAFFGFESLQISPRNKWDQNYWARMRFLPKIIPGRIQLGEPPFILIIPLIALDMNPAKEPYVIR